MTISLDYCTNNINGSYHSLNRYFKNDMFVFIICQQVQTNGSKENDFAI